MAADYSRSRNLKHLSPGVRTIADWRKSRIIRLDVPIWQTLRLVRARFDGIGIATDVVTLCSGLWTVSARQSRARCAQLGAE